MTVLLDPYSNPISEPGVWAMYNVRATGRSNLKASKFCHILSATDLCREMVSGGMVNSPTEIN